MIDQKSKIVFNKEIAPNTFVMGLRAPAIVSQAMPGQFVMIRIGSCSDPLLRRPFSICNTIKRDILLILYRVVGRGTFILSGRKKGEQVSVMGPLGRGFALPQDGRACILTAGGVGIAPLVFLARMLEDRDIIFLTGYPSVTDVVPLQEVGLKSTDIFVATDDGTRGHRGPVTELLEDHMLGREKDTLMIFACGPLPMLRRVAELTAERDLSCQVSLETNMACGLGACQGCAVRSAAQERQTYYHVCLDGPAFDIRVLDWRLL